MTLLSLEEIKAGLVSHLDQTMLTNDPAVLDTYPQRFTELRPFVCVSVEDDGCTWAPLSSTHRPERVAIEDVWRLGGIAMWRNRVCYLNDGANVYIVPMQSFISASHLEKTDATNRAAMAQDGVAAVLAEIGRQQRRRVNGRES